MSLITFWVIPHYRVNTDGLFQSEKKKKQAKKQVVNYIIHLVIGPCDTH